MPAAKHIINRWHAEQPTLGTCPLEVDQHQLHVLLSDDQFMRVRVLDAEFYEALVDLDVIGLLQAHQEGADLAYRRQHERP